jgi:hypothetical protein
MNNETSDLLKIRERLVATRREAAASEDIDGVVAIQSQIAAIDAAIAEEETAPERDPHQPWSMFSASIFRQ